MCAARADAPRADATELDARPTHGRAFDARGGLTSSNDIRVFRRRGDRARERPRPEPARPSDPLSASTLGVRPGGRRE
jgi:hypothetical protein